MNTHYPYSSLSVRQQRGHALFATHCSFCHASDGSGGNWIATFLEPHARDLTNASLRPRMDARRAARVIREGLPGTSMPAWRQVLTSDEIDALVDYLCVRHGWPETASAPASAQTTSAPLPTWRRMP